MATIFNSLYVLVAALLSICLLVQAGTIPTAEEADPASREGRFYGGASQASAFAAANAGSTGYGGYPYGGGLGLASANAVATANSGSHGFYGK